MSDRPPRLLLIDDDEDSFVITRGLLSHSAGTIFDLEWIDTYDAGLAALRQAQHDACLLDYRLGARTGLELLREAIAEGCRVPIIMLTSEGDHEIDLEALKAGAGDYLVKGHLTGMMLERAIRYTIERARANAQRLRTEAHLRLLMDQLPAILWTTDCQLRITSTLGAGSFGAKARAEGVVGSTLLEYFQTEDEAHPALVASRSALLGESMSFETEWLGRTYRGHIDLLRQNEDILAGTVGVALDITDHKQVQDEIRLARKIQQGLLPAHSPLIPGFNVAGVCHPAAATGGDYFDYMFMPDGTLGIVIADVSNHGFAPALIMAGTRRMLRTLADRTSDIAQMLTYANRALSEDTQPEDFVTLFFAQLDPRSRSLQYAGAGHEGFVLDTSGVARKLKSTALPLGIEPHSLVSLGPSVILEPGQVVVLLTDGIADAMNPEGAPFGTPRALAIVHDHRDKPADEILTILYQAVQDHCRPHAHHDDATAVLVKVEDLAASEPQPSATPTSSLLPHLPSGTP